VQFHACHDTPTAGLEYFSCVPKHLVNFAARFDETSVCALHLWVEDAAWVLCELFHSHDFENGWVDCGTKQICSVSRNCGSASSSAMCMTRSLYLGSFIKSANKERQFRAYPRPGGSMTQILKNYFACRHSGSSDTRKDHWGTRFPTWPFRLAFHTLLTVCLYLIVHSRSSVTNELTTCGKA
jgi:hypothetical protein